MSSVQGWEKENMELVPESGGSDLLFAGVFEENH